MFELGTRVRIADGREGFVTGIGRVHRNLIIVVDTGAGLVRFSGSGLYRIDPI